MKLSDWTKEDAEQATKEGWCLAEVWGSQYGSPQIQRIDEPEGSEPVFDSDESAWVFVYSGFLAGTKLCTKALYIMSDENPIEFKIIKEHCEKTSYKEGSKVMCNGQEDVIVRILENDPDGYNVELKENGTQQWEAKGIEVMAPSLDAVMLSPLNTRGVSDSCFIEIPVEHIPEVIEALTKTLSKLKA